MKIVNVHVDILTRLDDGPYCTSESYFCHLIKHCSGHSAQYSKSFPRSCFDYQKGILRGTSPQATHSKGTFLGTSSRFLRPRERERVLHYFNTPSCIVGHCKEMYFIQHTTLKYRPLPFTPCFHNSCFH